MRGRRVACAGLVLAALGGCGGGGSGGEGAPAEGTPPPQVAGTLSLIDGSGYSAEATAGREVRLVAINAEGSVTSVLARTSTTAGGRYAITLPATTRYGEGTAVEADDADGRPLRALVLGPVEDLSPASEAATQTYLAARGTYGAAFASEVSRLYRWQTATTTFLALTPYPPTGTSAGAVAALRDWLDDDVASRESRHALQSTGRLPATLGDIGGLQGIGTAAWEFADAGAGTSHLVVKPVSTPVAGYGYFRSPVQMPPVAGTDPSRS